MAVEVTTFPFRTCGTNVTIDSGSVTSSGGALGGTDLVGILFPAGMQGSTASIQASVDGTTYVDVYAKAGAQLQTSVGASRYTYLTPDDQVRTGWVRLIAAVSQTASRTVTLVSTAS